MTTTTFNKWLPDEILQIIFTRLSNQDLIECQKVHRTWTFPAKRLLLRRVKILNRYDLTQFMTYIEYHSDPSYLSAVEFVSIGDYSSQRSSLKLEGGAIKHVLSQLPNIKDLTIFCEQVPVKDFLDNEFCTHLSGTLESYKVWRMNHLETTYFYEFMYKLRHTLKCVTLPGNNIDSHPQDLIEYLSAFPQLREACIIGHSSVSTLEACQILCKRIPCLEKLQCEILKQEREVKELGSPLNLKELRLRVNSNLLEKTTKFICQDLAKLKKLDIEIWDNSGLLQVQDEQDAPLSDLLDLATARLEKYSVVFFNHPIEILVDCLQLATNSVLRTNCKGTLHLRLEVPSHYETRKNYAKVKGGLGRPWSILLCFAMREFEENQEAVDNIFSGFSTARVDTLVFESLAQAPRMSFPIQESLFCRLPYMTNIILKSLHFPSAEEFDASKSYQQVSTLQLDIMTVHKIQKEQFDTFIAMFPNLRYLKLHYFSGIWENSRCKYLIRLKGWRLERMNIDVTPIRAMTGIILKECTNLADAFFILTVDTVDNRKRRIFKVFLEFLKIMQIDDRDLEGLRRGKDYVYLHIKLDNLEYLDLHMYRKFIERNESIHYFEEAPEDVMNAKISLC